MVGIYLAHQSVLIADYDHEIINHMESYVEGNVLTNGLENFWALLRRGLHGTYVSIEPFHLSRCVDKRHSGSTTICQRTTGIVSAIFVRKVVGKRLT